jgi:hypothetical protein
VFRPGAAARVYTFARTTNVVIKAYHCTMACSGGAGGSTVFDSGTLTEGDIAFYQCSFPSGAFTDGNLAVGALKLFHCSHGESYDGAFAWTSFNNGQVVQDPFLITTNLIDPSTNGIIVRDTDYGGGSSWSIRLGPAGNVSMSGTNIGNGAGLTNLSLSVGFLPTNAMSGWPRKPQTHGGAALVNSNGTIYILTSRPGSLNWGATNKLAP